MITRVLCLFILLLMQLTAFGQQEKIRPLVDGALLEKASLKQVFQTALSVKPTEKLVSIRVIEDKIFALTSTNYLFCVNRMTGSPEFSRQLALADFPVLGPELFDGHVLYSSGSDLINIDLSTGSAVTTNIQYKAACAPVRTASYLYFAGTDKRLHVFDEQNKLHLFDVAANNDTLMTSVVAGPGSVVFATVAGNIVSIHLNSPMRIWQTDLPDKVTAPVIRDANSLYVGCWNTYIYKLKFTTGQIEWKYQMPGVLSTSAVISSKAVFQSVANHGITAIDKSAGTELFTVLDGVAMLAQTPGRTFVMTTDRNCAVVDNSTGKEMERFNFAQTALEASNNVDGYIYVADKQGRLACYAAK